ncbi:unnamed protein product [Thelazia callipaeda]|uniref:Poly [ADP-ribose] polymerase n=1 Tax=Thelazia callipaeda TaxID=103827 RepID=A0A0N5D698_THECL|nr:unnamed protein product [Thelazia callipaeda]
MAMGEKELPYSVEYAKSGRAGCKGCNGLISQNHTTDSTSKIEKFHSGCFWKKIKQNEINEVSIRGIELLKWKDQEWIRKKIADNRGFYEYLIFCRDRNGVSCAENHTFKLVAEYAITCRSKCVICKKSIEKNTLRLGLKSAWYHTNCFNQIPQHAITTENITGYHDLLTTDQKILKSIFNFEPNKNKKRKRSVASLVTIKKTKKEESAIKEERKRLQLIILCPPRKFLQAQADEMWLARQKLSKGLSKSNMQDLLRANNQALPAYGGESKLLDRLVDCIVFGCPLPCEQCKGGTIAYSAAQRNYVCTGYVSEYTHCTYKSRNPPRKSFIVPDDFKDFEEFKDFEVKVKDPKEREYSTLDEEVVKPKLFKLWNQKLKEADEDLISGDKPALNETAHKVQRQTVKNGAVVDPECDLDDVHRKISFYSRINHLKYFLSLKSGKLWDTTLGKVDFQIGANSFYKLQLLKHDVEQRYYLFRSWGRVGTVIGGTKTDKFRGNLDEAKQLFERLFEEKTGNSWKDVENFTKVPGKMSLIETDYKHPKDLQESSVKPGSLSKLPETIKQIVMMVFNVDTMNNILESLEIDTTKMPLGKLSDRQIKCAYKVLTELQRLIEIGNARFEDYLDATNRFFTLIPHNFGISKPPLLDSQKLLIRSLQDKTKLLDDLLQLEITYSILNTDNKADIKRDPVDVHYEKLHADLEIMDKASEEYKRILQYAVNTHAPTHDQYKLEIIDIIRVKCRSELEKFKIDISNHYLLWHGSRITNYAGILSQGLRIAPPEAPVTGYMFGKGIYFADMISKSANYCYAMNTEGLILLCEVALGEIQEEVDAKPIKKLKKGKHSVKGLGQIIPDPNEYFVTESGITLPMDDGNIHSYHFVLKYHYRYIVYDVAQVQIRYLVRAKFICSLF